MRPSRIIAIGAVAGALIVAVPIALRLSAEAPRLASSRYALNPKFSAFTRLSPGETACLADVFLPTDARTAQVTVLPFVAGETTPRLRLRARGPRGAPLFVAALPSTPSGGVTEARLPRLDNSVWPATLCLKNPSRTAVLVADNANAIFSPDAPPGSLHPRIDLLQSGRRTGFATLPNAVRRASLFKAGPITPAVIWLALLVAILLPVGGIAVLRRELTRGE